MEHLDGANDELWRLTAQHSPVGMALVSPSGRVLAVNDAACRFVGRDRATLLKLGFQELTHPDDLELDLGQLEATLAGEQASYRIRKRYLRANGDVVWGDLSVALLREPDGRPIHFISQIIDVTAEHEALRELMAAQATIEHNSVMIEALYDAVNVGLLLVDASGRFERMNRRHQEFMEMAFPDGHAGYSGQVGWTFDADGVTLLRAEQLPSYRATRGEEFDALPIWVGEDPLTRRAASVSARSIRRADGTLTGAALACTDVTDVMRALAVKDEFVASVSHELRTPMTSIVGHLEMLEERTDLPADVTAQIKVIDRNAGRLRRLVADLLHVAADQQGALKPMREEVDLVAVVHASIEAARPMIDQGQLTLRQSLPAELLASVDMGQLRQVIDNLISNAIKYTDPGGSIEFNLSSDSNEILLEVSDTGIGISPADLEQLFTRFFRADDAQARVVPGTGLGLTILRSIVQAHGGDVVVASELGSGSRFRVTLPCMAR